ncbi:MAG: HAMP domain-containing histidine kinase, partial [Chloroflexi bacterium]|nr:HAMP domain-containing histidine kinase [Chloroflexota bacterium]
LIYVSTTLLVVLFYVAGFTFSQYAFQAAPGYNPLFIGAVIALLLALIFTPLLGLVERTVDRWLRTEQRDPSRTLREYSDSISNILDMERLATVAVGLIMEAMDIQRGFLFLVDRETSQGDQECYRLRAVRSAGERPIRAGLLDTNGPIARHLTHEQRPLLQFDLDLLPVYRKTHPEERRWLSRLNAEVYVPIFAKREWIGLFALGAKLSGTRYTEKDLVTLGALAGQTAVALENARLVENLIRLNKEVRQAYRDLDKANRDLERLDRTKSDFISIASHELRTPLTVMRGYTEMLLENPSLDEGILQMVKGIHEGTLRLHEIMDSLFDIAQIDARTLQLHLQAVDVAELVRSVCSSLAKPIAERGQYLTIDLPAFPTIKADPNTLRKVFYHLMTNAIKFTPNGGKIVVGGKTLPSNRSDLPEGGIEIVISDTGVGVDPTFREIIFTKFYQPGEQLNKHSTGKTKFKGGGAGLGLALARGIVEAHGGKIWVESPGYDDVHFPGSHFHVVLPLRKQSESDTLPLGDAVKMKLSAQKK